MPDVSRTPLVGPYVLDKSVPPMRRWQPVSQPPLPSTSAYDEFRASVRDCEPALYVRALRLTKNPADARDLVQDTLLRGFRALHRFEAGTNLRMWLLRILVNLFLDTCRRTSRGPSFEPLSDQLAATRAADEDPEPIWARITPAQFDEALASLAPVFREAYVLRAQRGLSYDLIARELKVPMGTVATRIARARTKLRNLLTPHVDTDADADGKEGVR